MPDPSRPSASGAADSAESADGPVLWLDTAHGPLAYRRSGTPPSTGLRLVFCPGYRSDMEGTKARWLASRAGPLGLEVIRFDYRGHGRSPGRFEQLGIGDWLADLEAVLAGPAAGGPVILVGSSMGAWLAVLAAARNARVAGLVTLAAAPDFTEELLRPGLTPAEARQLAAGGTIQRPSRYGDEPYPWSAALLASGAQHRVIGRRLAFAGPARLIHGRADADVPWQLSRRLAEALAGAGGGTGATLDLVPDGDHRLSRPADLERLGRAVAAVAGAVRTDRTGAERWPTNRRRWC